MTWFGCDALVAFDSLIPLAYKAGLGRYCLLLECGGLYTDLSIHFSQAIADLSMLRQPLLRLQPNMPDWPQSVRPDTRRNFPARVHSANQRTTSPVAASFETHATLATAA